ncbi:MAG: YtxH domain-containing protein [Anaerolineales bacterium]|nr:YtxH domain-containing protein [Anaerolineales bacterium]
MSDRDSDFSAFLAGFIFGGLIGAAIALLYAPQSGEETRTIIREKSIELKDKAVESAEEARIRAEKALEEARIKAEKAIAETRQRAEELASLTRERAIELQQRGQEILEEQKTKLGQTIEAGKKAVKKETGTGEEPAAS